MDYLSTFARLVYDLKHREEAPHLAGLDSCRSALDEGEQRLRAKSLTVLIALIGGLIMTSNLQAQTQGTCPVGPAGIIDLDFTTPSSGGAIGTSQPVRFDDVGSVNGMTLDMIAEVVSLNNITGLNELHAVNGSLFMEVPALSAEPAGTEYGVTMRYTLVQDGSAIPVPASFEILIDDVDRNDTQREESLSLTESEIEGFFLDSSTTLNTTTDGTNLTVMGTQSHSGGEPEASIKVLFQNTDAFTIVYRMTKLSDPGRGTGRAGFTMDASDLTIIAACDQYDYGDAPDDYATLDASGGPAHQIDTNLYLGSVAPDGDNDGLPSSDAGGDDNAFDDEDGVTFPTLTQGQGTAVPVTVTQTIGGAGSLQGWIDWNGDGDFADTVDGVSERIATNLSSISSGTSTIDVGVTVPVSATTAQTFARFRWSTTSDLDSTTTAPDGEVEDYPVTIVGPSGPAFPPGSGLAGSVCNATSATNPWQDIGLRWEFNGGSPEGTSPDASIDNAGIFASATVGSYVGINAQINGFDLNIDADTIPATYDPSHYIQYQFTTAAFTNAAEVTGVAKTLFGRRSSDPNDQATGAYRFAIAIDNDPSFASPEVLMSDVILDGVDTSAADASNGVSDPQGRYLQDFAHWDANGVTVELDPSTTYTMRIYPHGVTEFGDDNDQPFTNVVLWDDFMPKAVSCASTATLDYGDASGFADGANYGDAFHTIDGVTFLGTAPSAEAASQTTNGDASDDANDDGVTFPKTGALDILRLDEPNAISVNASVAGVMNAWIDWNQDGDFDDVGEQFATDQSLTAGANVLSLTVPIGAPMGPNFLRFRFSSETGLGPTGAASNGEVEDYRVYIARPLPVGICSNVIRNNGFETPDTGRFTQPLETSVEYWATIPSNPTSSNFNRMNAIEVWQSGFNQVPAYEGSQFAELNAHVAGGLYQDVETLVSGNVGWRFAHRGRSGNDTVRVLIGPPESEVEVGRFTTGTSGWEVYSGIYSAPAGQPITRFKLEAVSAQGGVASGNFIDAVEFYGACDFGDAPNTYATNYASGGAYHVANSQHFLGALLGDSESDAFSGDGLGDDGDNVIDEDGITLPVLTQFVPTTITAAVTGADGYLQGWIDWNGSGAFDAGEQIAADLQDGDALDTDPTVGTISFAVTPPVDANTSQAYARFRWSTTSGLGPTGFASDGEVEDYPLTVHPGSDYGDAPVSFGSVSHVQSDTIRMGGTVTIDVTDFDNLTASGDTGDDGVVLPALTPGGSGVVTVNVVGAGASLNAWIDWDGSGNFNDPVEHIAQDMFDNDGDGQISFVVTAPGYATTSPTFARFRWSSDFSIGPNGPAPDGEVEDYPLTLGSTGTQLSGTLFVDNGIGGTTAHDGLIGGTELTAALGTIDLYETAGGTVIATATVNPDGTWQAILPVGFAGEVRLETIPVVGYRTISEDVSTLPSPTNANARDGTYSFTPAAGVNYIGLNIGLITEPTLTQDQTAAVTPGQIIELSHVYTASTAGTVNFALVDPIANPVAGFNSALFVDAACNGQADPVPLAAVVVSAGQQVCFVVRTQAGSGVSPTATYSYGIEATTIYSGTTVVNRLRNSDALGTSGSAGDLVLEKLVSNITKLTPESRSNTGDIGDVLQYRIVMTNPGPGPATGTKVFDATPAYTVLSSSIASPVSIAGVTCTLTTPNVVGYAGPIEWDCPGSIASGQTGSLTFQVQIAP